MDDDDDDEDDEDDEDEDPVDPIPRPRPKRLARAPSAAAVVGPFATTLKTHEADKVIAP